MVEDSDQELQETRKNWSEFFKELEHLNTVAFPRCLTQTYAVGAPMLCILQVPQEKPLVRSKRRIHES